MQAWLWSKKGLGLLLISLVVLVAAGCQALNGVDFNGMLKQSISATSFEGNETIEFKLLLNEDAADELTGEEGDIIKLLSTIKLQLDEVKTSQKGMSAKGSLDVGSRHIGFAIKMNDTLAELNLEGAKQPIILHLTDLEADAVADQQSITQAGQAIVNAVSGYGITNLPNPAHLSALPGQQTVNGDTVTGMNIHAELSGKELWNWLKSYLDALIADKQGLKAMLRGLLEALQSQSDLLEATPAASIFGSLPDENVSSKEVNDAADEIYGMLTELKDQLTQAEEEDGDTLDLLLNEGTYVKGDVFIDSKLDVRKAVFEAAIAPKSNSATADSSSDDLLDEGMLGLIKGIWMKVTTSRWNVNGDVQPAQPVQPSALKTTLDAEKLMGMQGYEALRQFDSGSAVYDLLRNGMHITKQTVLLSPVYSNNPPIVTPSGITIIPLRYTAESLGAVLTKSGSELRVLDGATNKTISLKTGSSNAMINGKTVKWSFPTTVVNGVTYVAGRDFAKAMGAQISWEQGYGSSKTLVLVREP